MTKVPNRIQKLRNARLNAVQALYMYEQSDFSLDEILNGFLNGTLGKEVLDEDMEREQEEFIPIMGPDVELLSFILKKFGENMEHIDAVLVNSLDGNWSSERLELVLKSILRSGLTEMMYRMEVDVATLIDEYVGLADSFYQDGETKLVHAVLHKVGNALR